METGRAIDAAPAASFDAAVDADDRRAGRWPRLDVPALALLLG